MQECFSRSLAWTAVLCAVALSTNPVAAQAKKAQPAAQPPAEKAAPPASEPAAEAAPAANGATGAATQKYQQTLEEWKSLLKDMRKLKAQYITATSAGQSQMSEQWKVLVDKGNKLLPQLTEAAKNAYVESPSDPELIRFLTKSAADAINRDDYQAAADLSQVLIDNESDDKSVYNSAAIAAYVLNDYDKAAELFKKANEAGVVSQYGRQLESTLDLEKAAWAKEQEIRKAEAEADDLPRVKLTTTKGDIVLELFENEAPDTVGNFISLVEKKFYDGLSFHRVLANFMAQGGDPKGDGTGGPGYQIYCECYKPDYRRHFQGTLSMAHAGKDTGGSQFFITFRQTPELDGKHTAFGRVIEGMDVLSKIQRRDPSGSNLPEPDRILSAEVIRKRDHAYEPRKVE